MDKPAVKPGLLCLLIASSLLLSACQGLSQQDQKAALADWVVAKGFSCTVAPSEPTEDPASMPIFNQSVWDTFWVNGEALYVYFDTSNRAKQLCQQFCSDPDEGRSVAFGLRFIVNYRGNEESIYKLMDEMAAVE